MDKSRGPQYKEEYVIWTGPEELYLALTGYISPKMWLR